MLCAPFTGLRSPQELPYPPLMTFAPFCHLTPLLRHIEEGRIPAPSLGHSWQQLQEAGPAQHLRCHSMQAGALGPASQCEQDRGRQEGLQGLEEGAVTGV